MNNRVYLWYLFICLMQFCRIIETGGYQMNMTDYFRMPQLYTFDNYDHCLQQFPQSTSTYCFVRAEIKPKNDSRTWQTIVEISKYKYHHFDHRQLYYGLCVNWCEQQLAKLSETQRAELYAGELTTNEKVNTYLRLFNAEESNRQRFNRLMNQCLNLKLKQLHPEDQLQAVSVIEYCDNNHQAIVDDAWNFLFYGIVLSLVLLTICSSFYDLYLKLKRNNKLLTDRDHYKAPPNGLVNRAFVIFSVARNWYRLTQEPNGKIGRDFRFLDCFKFFCMFLVIFAHTNWILYESAISNPQDPERLLHTLAGTLLLSGSLITVTFFVIGGLLLTVSWLEVIKLMKIRSLWDYLLMFLKFNVFRYIRLTVPYGFMILMSGVYFDNAGGPMWRHIMEREQLVCRKNWWINLLYINTFVNTDERCLLQGWYLATDAHCFVLSLILLMIAHRWRQLSKYIYIGTLALFFVIPAVIAYVWQYDAYFVASPQTQRDSFIGDRMFTELYTPFYMNFGCYFCGVLAALAYDRLLEKQVNLRDSRLFQAICYALIPTGVLGLFATHSVLQDYDSQLPLIWGSLFVGFQRNAWGFGLSVLILGMTSKIGWVLRKFSCLPIFRILGRLTYGAFVAHLLFGRLVIGTLREPIYFGTGIMFSFIFFTVTASYLFSLLLALFIELPVSSFLKLMR